VRPSPIDRRKVALALLSVAVLQAPALADWAPGGNHISRFWADYGVRDARIVDMPSGDLAALAVGKGGNGRNFQIQRFSRTGAIAAGWPADGVSFTSVLGGYAALEQQSFVADEDGNFWHAWLAGTADAQFVDGSGTLVPTPYPNYFSFGSTGSAGPVHAIPTGGGRMWVTKGSNQLLSVTRTGSFAGFALPGDPFDDHALLPDGRGGAIVFMRSSAANAQPIALRVDSLRVRHTGWPAGGLPLSSIVNDLSDFFAFDSALLPSGSDHALAVWTTAAGPDQRIVRMQRFGFDGTLDPSWPADGMVVLGASTLRSLTLLSDRNGGAFLLRQLAGVPVATHIAANGTIVAGPDVSILDAGAVYVPTYEALTDAPDHLIADVTPGGDLLVGWGDNRFNTTSFRVRWLLPDLTADPVKPDTGVVVIPTSAYTTNGSMLAVHADANDGAFVAWAGYNNIAPNGDLWMTHVGDFATVGVTPPPALRASRLTLSRPRPNPASGSVALDLTLPDAGAARVELLDVAGRLLRTRQVEGAGTHRVEFRDLEVLTPGLYFVKATRRGETIAVRVTLSR